MKKIKYLILCPILCFCCNLASGQVDPKSSVSNNATDRANSKIDDGVNKSLDKVEHGVGSLFKKKHKSPDSPPAEKNETTFSEPQYILVINYKSSDEQSKLNAEKLSELILSDMAQPMTYYSNDLSNHNTASASGRILNLLGLAPLSSSFAKAGAGLLIDLGSKTIIKTIKLGTPDKESLKIIQSGIEK